MPSDRNPKDATRPASRDKAVSLLLVAILLLFMLSEWIAMPKLSILASFLVVPLLAFMSGGLPLSRSLFLIVGLMLVAISMITRPDWFSLTQRALTTAAFIAAFFTALATLRNASQSSETIERCGRFLAAQKPGRRYLALTLGGHAFALPLNYGSLVLLGSFAEASAREEPDPQIRAVRTRRMLLAIQRGFISSIPWSPLGFAIAISTTLIPGASWSNAFGYCIVTAFILTVTGWALDTLLKPKLSRQPVPQTPPEGGWTNIRPLIVLLCVLAGSVGGLHMLTGIRTVAVVLLVVPLISAGWIALQTRASRWRNLALHARQFLETELPYYRSELVLLIMAGFIGSLGGALLTPLLSGETALLASYPPVLILLAIVWLIPLAGQIGMNPILSVSLIAPLLPLHTELGVAPGVIVAAITAGWAITGASSPYTATTVLIGSMGGVSALRVGLSWNGAYTLICLVILSAFVAAIALW